MRLAELTGRRRPLAGAVFGAAIFAVLSAPALAQTWSEPKYNPEVGSTWSVVSVSDSEDMRPGGQRLTQQIRSRTEFTIDEKLPDGFRISYVTREIKIVGNAPGNQIAEMAFSAMKDIVVHGRTDASGKPVAVENFDEVKSTMRTVIARMTQAFEKQPKVADVVRQMMSGILDVGPARAAEVYMEDLPPLAAGQTTGIVPGGVRRQNESTPSPIGAGAMKSTLETRLESFDAASGKARYVRKRVFDKDSMRTVVLALSEKLMSATDKKAQTPEILRQIKDISFDIESEAVISVEGGMTRRIDDRSVTTARLMGHQMRKVEKKTVAVTRLK